MAKKQSPKKQSPKKQKTAAKRSKTVAKKLPKKLPKKAAIRKRRVKTVAPRLRDVMPEAVVTRAAGFDTGSYPGDAAITTWAATSPYAFVGFYFDAPCHTTSTFKTWSGKRAFIQKAGLGLAVVYVGLQQDGCGKTKLSRTNGVTHGLDAIAKSMAEGFRPGTIVFLDVEQFSGTLSTPMEDYIRGWIGALLDNGSIAPGIYCPANKATAIRRAAQKEYVAHERPDDGPAFWIVKVGNNGFDPKTSNPEDCGVPFASVWQGVIDISERHGDVTIGIDQNVATSANPSGA